jgi:hypothetical protein
MLGQSLPAALVAALLISSATSHARADVITFEAQGAGRGGQFTGNPDSPLSIGPVTFQGGELLNGETGFSTDETAVYAITNFRPGYGSAITIDFATPVSGVGFLLTNFDDGQYLVSDDQGGSQSFTLALTDPSRFITMAESNITHLTIQTVGPQHFDFAIDNLSWSTPVPEPSTFALCAVGCTVPLCRRIGRRCKSGTSLRTPGAKSERCNTRPSVLPLRPVECTGAGLD